MQVSGCGGYCEVHLSCKKNLSKPATASMASSGSNCDAMGKGERLIVEEIFSRPQPKANRQRIATAPWRTCRVEPSREQSETRTVNIGIHAPLPRKSATAI